MNLGHPERAEERRARAAMKRSRKKRATRRIVRLVRLEKALREIAALDGHSWSAKRIAREALTHEL